MMLSILILSIPERLPELKVRMDTYQSWINLYDLADEVEIVAIVDNKKRTIGEKRNIALEMANGQYIVFTDDDDWLTQKYFSLIESVCAKGADVITYEQEARINEDRTTVVFGLKLENEEFNKNGVTKRMAWHCCTWLRKVVQRVVFPFVNYGEDDPWARWANLEAKTSVHIPEVCHIYAHDSTKTASFDERGN